MSCQKRKKNRIAMSKPDSKTYIPLGILSTHSALLMQGRWNWGQGDVNPIPSMG